MHCQVLFGHDRVIQLAVYQVLRRLGLVRDIQVGVLHKGHLQSGPGLVLAGQFRFKKGELLRIYLVQRWQFGELELLVIGVVLQF